jgi:hypothetical protein
MGQNAIKSRLRDQTTVHDAYIAVCGELGIKPKDDMSFEGMNLIMVDPSDGTHGGAPTILCEQSTYMRSEPFGALTFRHPDDKGDDRDPSASILNYLAMQQVGGFDLDELEGRIKKITDAMGIPTENVTPAWHTVSWDSGQ